jgi:hypothetical protein
VAVDGVAVLARGHVYKLAIDSQTNTLVRWPRRLVSTAQMSPAVSLTSDSNWPEPDLASGTELEVDLVSMPELEVDT